MPSTGDVPDVLCAGRTLRGELPDPAATELRDDAPERGAIVGRTQQRIEQRVRKPRIIGRAMHLPVGARRRDCKQDDEREGSAAHDAP